MRARYLRLGPLISWKLGPRPVDWTATFGREAPLEVELGFGNGEYLARRASESPERNLVGIEVTWGSIRRGLRKIAQTERGNVRLLWEDAKVAMLWCFAPRSVSRALGLFPCPWPKKRHAKNRLFGRSFLELVNSRLADGGQLIVVTDHADYRDEVLDNARGTGFSSQLKVVPPSYGTKYERKWEEGGQKEFYEIMLAKEEHRDIPVPREVAVEKQAFDRFDPDKYAPEDLRGEMSVIFKSFLFDPVRQRGMQEVIAIEESLSQRFWIEIVLVDGRWWVGPAPGCDVVPLASVQEAIRRVRLGATRCLT